MKFLIQLSVLLALTAAGVSLHAAPRAAEDPSAVVISTNESAPYVKRQAPKQAQATPKKKAANKTAPAKKPKPVKKASKR